MPGRSYSTLGTPDVWIVKEADTGDGCRGALKSVKARLIGRKVASSILTSPCDMS